MEQSAPHHNLLHLRLIDQSIDRTMPAWLASVDAQTTHGDRKPSTKIFYCVGYEEHPDRKAHEKSLSLHPLQETGCTIFYPSRHAVVEQGQ
jgi:hypothetical protein